MATYFITDDLFWYILFCLWNDNNLKIVRFIFMHILSFFKYHAAFDITFNPHAGMVHGIGFPDKSRIYISPIIPIS
jgi:hypothetical protein